jgi:hypothetical protein
VASIRYAADYTPHASRWPQKFEAVSCLFEAKTLDEVRAVARMRHLILRTEQVFSARYVAPPGLSLSLGLLTHSLRCGLLISHPLRGFFLCVG